MDTEATDSDALKGPGKGNRRRCPTCRTFGSLHPLNMCKKCGGGTIRCIIGTCNEPVEWVGYKEGNDKGAKYAAGTPCRYCHDHRYRVAPSPFRDSFETGFNESRHGWRQEIEDDFPIVNRRF